MLVRLLARGHILHDTESAENAMAYAKNLTPNLRAKNSKTLPRWRHRRDQRGWADQPAACVLQCLGDDPEAMTRVNAVYEGRRFASLKVLRALSRWLGARGALRFVHGRLNIAAAGCYAEALRAGVEGNEHLVCAQSCHQLSEVRQAQGRLHEAIAWSILAFAMLDTASQRRHHEDFSNLADLAERVSLEACQDAWLSVTGEPLPIKLRQSVQRLLPRAVRALA